MTRIDLPSNDWDAAVGDAAPLPCFVAGPENRLAAIALERLLSDEQLPSIAKLFNPLVLTGPTGSGKSHLVRGIIRHWGPRLGADRVAYFTATDFARQLYRARSSGELGAFRTTLTELQLLVIEDLHKLPRREFPQVELRDLMDQLLENESVVLATSQQSTTTLAAMESGLRDRFAGGLQVCLRVPSAASRRHLLRCAADARQLAVEETLLDQLAERIDGPAPHVLRALAEWELEATTNSLARTRTSSLTLKQIIAVVARYFSLTQSAICSAGRRKSLVHARAIVIYLARQLTDLSYSQIGHGLGRRDHSTIMHSQRNIHELLSVDPETRNSIEHLQRILSSR